MTARLGSQADIFDLIEDTVSPKPPPVTLEAYRKRLPAHYAEAATGGREWHWMVSSTDHKVVAAGHEFTEGAALTKTLAAIERWHADRDGAV